MIKEKIKSMAIKAQEASRKLVNLTTDNKNYALNVMADNLESNTKEIVKENLVDLENGKKNGLSSALIERLTLNSKRVSVMASGLRDIASLPDPIGEILDMKRLPNGLQLGRMRTPIGVIGIIYESRPNVTVDTSGLCLKSGNSVILKGGSESINSNIAIAKILSYSCKQAGIPEGAIQLIDIADREAVSEMLKQDNYIDLIIPRGGHSLIRAVVEQSTIPVIKHDKGLCHVYIDKDADFEMGIKIVLNSKTQRPSVCNSTETLLVHKDISTEFIPMLLDELTKKGVEIRGCNKTKQISPNVIDAAESDWSTEYLDMILSIKVVDSIDNAVDHINLYSSMLAESIITDNYSTAWKFLKEVDSAAVYVNASTRFTDGGEFGLGAEMGISTQKLHCRGPMGLKELTSTKYIGFGSGQIRGGS